MNPLLRQVLDARSRISTQLYLGLGGAVALTVTASLVGWVWFNRVAEVQSRVNEGSVPALAAAFTVARQSGALVAAAPRLAAATPADIEQITARIAEDRRAFDAQLADLVRQGIEEGRSRRLSARGAALLGNIDAVEELVIERFELAALRREKRAELSELRLQITGLMAPAIDDQLFYAMTGYRELGDAPAPRERHLAPAEFGRYRNLADLQGYAATASQLLAFALNVSDASLLEPLRERFEASARGIEGRLAALGPSALRDRLTAPFSQLIRFGIDPEGSVIDLRAEELEVENLQRQLLVRNRSLGLELVSRAESLVEVAQQEARDATDVAEKAIFTGQNLLVTLSVVSVVGAVLIAWLLIGRGLLRRLALLSDRMRRMAGGDLEGEVDIIGNDEVAEMAAALEIFRRHALEVQRLNLVEKLADELRGKNDQLEDALTDLRAAQDQIVMRQKLAALGELTAGVAHEIRNPLNFIKNFSESSVELMEELQEEVQTLLGEEEEGAENEGRALIQEIGNDLVENLQTIRQHGTRADQIVQSMLTMGRSSGERQMVDVNRLLDEHARLAYHSARAADPDFNLSLEQDLDPELGELEAIPEDLGRVFLNLVSNACYATDEKRRAGGAERYNPALNLITRRRDDQIEIRVRDNGNGIPPETLEKIFHPFFTTKPTDQGTGLGLALSSDIVRQHGGAIRVETEPGEFTEMIVELPLVPSADAIGGESADGEDASGA